MTLQRWALEHLPLPRGARGRWYKNIAEKEYRNKLAAAMAAGDAKETEFLRASKQADEYFDYEADEIEFTHRLVRHARKLRVPLPEYPDRGEENEWWAMSYSFGERYLTMKGIVEVRDAIRKEERWRSERIGQWLGALAGITGVFGTLIGLFTIRCR